MPNLLGKIASWLRRRAQPAPLDAGNLFAGMSEEEVKAMLSMALRGAHDEGMAAEKSRIEAILSTPSAAKFADLAADLVRGPATATQAIAVLDRAEIDAATRAGLMKSVLERASADAPTLH